MSENSNIKWLENSQIDKTVWDNAVAQSNGVNLYCYSWYLDAVSESWGALVYGDYEFVMPIPFTIKKGQEILYQPFFSQQINIVGKSSPTVEVINEFISNIPEKFKLVQFNFPNYSILKTLGYEVEEVVCQVLDVNKNHDEIIAAYSTNAKRQIKKAVKNELKIIEEGNLDLFMDLFKETVGEKLNFDKNNYARLSQLMKTGLENDFGKLVTVKKDNSIVAMGYFFIQNHRITYLKGASTDAGRELGAMYFLMDEMLKQYSNSKKIVDFGGSKVSSIAEFYKKLGGKNETYLSFSKNKLPFLVKKGKALRDKWKK